MPRVRMVNAIVSFSQEQIAKQPKISVGDDIVCPHCDGEHMTYPTIDPATGDESTYVLFYRCGDNTYLAAIGDRDVTHLG